MLVLLILLTVISFVLIPKDALVSHTYASLGVGGLAIAIIYAFVQTGLAEELFFRGFLAKRLIDKLGFKTGNTIQASMFGVVHGLLFFAVTTPIVALVITLLTGFLGWTMALLNERYAGGSIIPSWIIHGSLNMIAVIVAYIQINL